MDYLPPHRYIDLTGRLPSLKHSLTPDTKHFEPAPTAFREAPRPDVEAASTITRLGIAFLLITSAILLAYAIAAR